MNHVRYLIIKIIKREQYWRFEIRNINNLKNVTKVFENLGNTLTSPSSFPIAKSLSSSSKLTKEPIVDFEPNNPSIRTLTFPDEDLTRQSLPSEELQIKSKKCLKRL